jgi:phosphodiesterase/alkaline phosphatase D-like protein
MRRLGLYLAIQCVSLVFLDGVLASGVFNHGVASGDPYADSVVLWTRVSTGGDDPVEVAWDISKSEDFASGVASGVFETDKERDYTVKVIVAGLIADTRYFYRFSINGGENLSPTGRTKTLPVGVTDEVRLAVFACSVITVGDFDAFAKAAEIGDYDAMIHTGDYIYEYGPEYDNPEYKQPDSVFEPPNELRTLNDYRLRYAQYHREPSLQAARASAPFIVIWDDHEVADSAYKDGSEAHDDELQGISWAERRANGMQAYYEWQPIRKPASGNLIDGYRSFDFGDLVSLHMLETRHVALDKPLAVPGEDDIAKTISELVDPARREETLERLSPFGLEAQSIPGDLAANEATQESFGLNVLLPVLLAEVLEIAYTDPNRHILGEIQLNWLKEKMNGSSAPWQVLGHQRLIQENKVPAAAAPLVTIAYTLTEQELFDFSIPFFVALGKRQAGVELTELEESYFIEQVPAALEGLEDWNGYAVERDAMLNSVPAGKKLVSLVGNTHNSFASPLRKFSDDTVVGIEFGAPGVSASGYERFSSANAFEVLISGYNPDLTFVDLEYKGFLDVSFTADEVEARYIFKTGTPSEPVWEIQPLSSTDGLSLSMGIAYNTENTDIDGDGLFDWQELGLGTDPANPDTDADGYSDRIEALNAGLGFDPTSEDSSEILANLYTASQLQALAVGAPVLKRDPDSGNFILRVKLKKAATVDDWKNLPASSGSLRVAEDGAIEFEFSSPGDAALFRIEAGSGVTDENQVDDD